MQFTRKRVYELLNPNDGPQRLGRIVDLALMLLITLNVIAVILETNATFFARWRTPLLAFDIFSVAIFTIEYLLRLWTCVEDPRFANKPNPRLRYALTPMALIDLIAILPFYLSFLFTMDLRVLRSLRLLRVFKLTRYSTAMTLLLEVFREEASTFFAAFFLLFVLLIIASSGAYFFEHEVQPEAFGSIPAAMWWALVTLTTVGYGDVIPLTIGGRIFGGMVTVIGVGMAALPAGIMASGFADQMHKRRDMLKGNFRKALEDGVIDTKEAREFEDLRKRLGLTHDEANRICDEVRLERKTHPPHDQGEICPHCHQPFRRQNHRKKGD